MMKSTLEIMPNGVGAILKWEATPATRVRVPAVEGTKQGTLVQYTLADNVYFPALTDEQNGTVLIQPLNCVMDTRAISNEDIAKAGGFDALRKAWFKLGVVVDDADSRARAAQAEFVPPTYSEPEVSDSSS